MNSRNRYSQVGANVDSESRKEFDQESISHCSMGNLSEGLDDGFGTQRCITELSHINSMPYVQIKMPEAKTPSKSSFSLVGAESNKKLQKSG
mmetsp:Transcript_41030/g.30179  ORF Transcript_41030/g.30179 Transcript_41030/m.30179 type:complete len:92 (+) Transcript_41030:100-375(+)